MKNYKKQIHEKEILGERLKYFMHEVIPVELLPFLSSLQQMDREAVEASQRNEGPTRANHILVDKLKRRPKGFQNFVQALRKCGYEHTALLLDPYYNYPGKPFLIYISLFTKYLLLIEFEVRTVKYGPSFFPSIYGPSAKRAGHKSMGKTRIRILQYGPRKRG